MPETKPLKLSPSAINLMLECPRCFWLEKHKVWNKPSGILLMGAVDNILSKGKKLIVLDYKTRGYPLKEDTHEHYQAQMDIYNFLLRKNGYDTEDYTYLLFYYPKEVSETGELIFDTKLIKMKTNAKKGEEYFKEAIELLEGDCPKKTCEWCEKV